ncbi:MAG: DUF2059 domain-containing protein [Sphingomonadaceae bacterium]|nr:DUF2059 domain-containing protein [Sphingomonadaceae bacterium]
MKNTLSMIVVAAGLSAASPLDAQESMPPSLLGEAFKAEPLTAEEEARLPAAEQVVDRIFPPGTYRRMMDETMQPVMDQVMGGMLNVPIAELARIGGIPEEDVKALGDGTLREAMSIMDPAYEERMRISNEVTLEFITDLMDRIEPAYRAGLARAYAKRFTAAELAELDRFFQTPVGSHYAAESMLIMADPQVMAAMNEMMPAMLEMLPGMMQAMQDRTAHLPKARSYSDLSDDEKAQLADLLGTDGPEPGTVEPAY